MMCSVGRFASSPRGREMKRSARLCVRFAGIMDTRTTRDRLWKSLGCAAAMTALLVLPVSVSAGPGNAFRVLVVPFSNESHSGFLNLDTGVASLLAVRLATAGYDVVDWNEVEATLQSLGLPPHNIANLFTAARSLAAEYVVTGTVHSINIKEASLYIGFLRFSGGSADVDLSVDVYAANTEALVGSYVGSGYEEGNTGFTVELSSLFLAAEETAVCTGGLRAAQGGYGAGQPVTISYRSATEPSGWYSVEIFSSAGRFLRWLGWEYVERNECVQWSWDQTDSLGVPVNPSIYSARISDGTTVLEYTNFQIRPDTPDTTEIRQITVGETEFSETIVGRAMSCAVAELDNAFAPVLASLASQVEAADSFAAIAEEPKTGSQAEESELADASTIEGQVAAILPDGRVAVTLGITSGVVVGDTLLVFSTDTSNESVVSPSGEIVITEVRDHVSYAVPAEDAVVAVGDVVRMP